MARVFYPNHPIIKLIAYYCDLNSLLFILKISPIINESLHHPQEFSPCSNRSQRWIIRENPSAKVHFSFETTKQILKNLPIHIKIPRYAQESKKEEKPSFKQIKNKKSWFKLVQVSLFRYFFADLFPIFNYYYYLCDQISFKHTSNILKKIYK